MTHPISNSVLELADIDRILDWPKDLILESFRLDGYDPHGPIKGSVAV